MKRRKVLLSLLWPGHLLFPGSTVPKHEPLPERTARSEGIWETRHQFSAQPGDGKVSLVDRCHNIYQRLYTYWVTNE